MGFPLCKWIPVLRPGPPVLCVWTRAGVPRMTTDTRPNPDPRSVLTARALWKVSPAGLGDVGPAAAFQHADGEVTEGGHDGGAGAGADLGGALTVGDIGYVVEGLAGPFQLGEGASARTGHQGRRPTLDGRDGHQGSTMPLP